MEVSQNRCISDVIGVGVGAVDLIHEDAHSVSFCCHCQPQGPTAGLCVAPTLKMYLMRVVTLMHKASH